MGIKEEFQIANFLLNHTKPHEFARSQYKCPHSLFILWKVFWVIFHTGWMVRSVQLHISENEEEHHPKWLIYLTNWSYLLLTLQSYLHLGVVSYHTYQGHSEPEEFGTEAKWFHKTLWFITNITYDASIVVTVLYWGLVFKELTDELTIVTHAVNSVYTVSDTMVSGTPHKLLHFWFSVIYVAIYALFSVFYHLAEGTNVIGEPYIYSSLDWSKTGVTSGLVLAVMFVAVPLVHLFMFGLTKLRLYFYQTCKCGCCENEKDEKGVVATSMEMA